MYMVKTPLYSHVVHNGHASPTLFFIELLLEQIPNETIFGSETRLPKHFLELNSIQSNVKWRDSSPDCKTR